MDPIEALKDVFGDIISEAVEDKIVETVRQMSPQSLMPTKIIFHPGKNTDLEPLCIYLSGEHCQRLSGVQISLTTWGEIYGFLSRCSDQDSVHVNFYDGMYGVASIPVKKFKLVNSDPVGNSGLSIRHEVQGVRGLDNRPLSVALFKEIEGEDYVYVGCVTNV